MSSAAYVLARLPRLYADALRRPCSRSEFLGLILDDRARHWCASVLDWLLIANREARRLGLPLPYPDAGEPGPAQAATDNPWRAYYRRLAALDVPPLIRNWAAEDAIVLNHRARLHQADSNLDVNVPPRSEVLAMIETDTAVLDIAHAADRQLLAYVFRSLDRQLMGEAPDASEHLYAYAIRLLLLNRAGLPMDTHDAA